MSRLAVLLAVLAAFSGCLTPIKKANGPLQLSEDRLANLTLVEKVTGDKEFLLFSLPRQTFFLEGYIKGQVTDYAGSPIEGVTVRATLQGKAPPGSGLRAMTETGLFDPGVSDAQGIYRIRFSLPVVDGKVDVKGKLQYNPGWEQEKAALGHSYEPQVRESAFRLYYDGTTGLSAFGEGLQRVIVQPVASETAASGGLPGAKAPAVLVPPAAVKGRKPAPANTPAPADADLFKGFGFGQ